MQNYLSLLLPTLLIDFSFVLSFIDHPRSSVFIFFFWKTNFEDGSDFKNKNTRATFPSKWGVSLGFPHQQIIFFTDFCRINPNLDSVHHYLKSFRQCILFLSQNQIILWWTTNHLLCLGYKLISKLIFSFSKSNKIQLIYDVVWIHHWTSYHCYLRME